MTFKEKLAIEYPDHISPANFGGCAGCPSSHEYESEEHDLCNEYGDPTPRLCERCWNREIPGTEPTENTKDKKEKKEMEPRNFSSMATMAESPRKAHICEDVRELHNILLEVHNKTEALAHLLFGGEGPTCSFNSEPACLADDVSLTKEVAIAIMSKLVTIEEKL